MVNVQGNILRKDGWAQVGTARYSVDLKIRPDAFRSNGDLHKKDRFCAGSTMKNTGRRVAYMRVSTAEQSTDRQALGLRGLCDEIHMEHISAVAQARPVFEYVIARLCPGDTFVVWDLDRAFRSTIDALLIMEKLRSRKINLHIVTMHLDTTTPEGELFYTVLAGFGQYERRIISRRTKEGIEAARRRGARIGRPPVLDRETTLLAHYRITEDNLPCRYVATLLGVSRMTLQRAFKRYGLTYSPMTNYTSTTYRKENHG